MRALLLDLRNNAGGGLEVCVRVAAQFTGPGPVVYIQERGGEREPRTAPEDASPFDLPLVVLTNLGSASAAEILAGAVQDADLGTLVGAKTFGKGLVQTVIPLRDGSALALTTARYFTPTLRDIDRKGITPDDLLVHDEKPPEPTLAYLLSRMHYPEFPEPMGVFRAVDAPSYERLVLDQIASATQRRGDGDLEELLNAGDTWTVE